MRAKAGFSGAVVHEAGRGRILDGVAGRLVERDLVSGLPAGLGLRQDLAHLGDRFLIHSLQLVRAGGRPVGHRSTPLDKHPTYLDRVTVDLGSERTAHRADMYAGLEPLTPEDRIAGVGAARDHIRAADRVLKRFHHAGQRAMPHQFPRAVQVARCDPDFSEIAHARKRLEVRSALDARAQDRKHTRVFAG